MTSPTPTIPTELPKNFIRGQIDVDLAQGKWSRVETRFPPEPNGYLHIGHAKSICLNFGLARDYNGVCHLRFDDTNPVKEDQEYVDSIIDAVRWLGFDWKNTTTSQPTEHLYYASDYFEQLYQCAEYLISADKAYVDSQSAEEMRINRGTLTEAGTPSRYRNRPIEESLDLFRRMRAGEFADGTHIVRAKIDMASPNMNLRDPAIYRIRHAHHHRTGDQWCIYPMYDYAHPISDAIENITHSICTLEFADHRPFYDWVLAQLAEGEFFKAPLPQQIEFARLNLTYTVTSKRKLHELVTSGAVSGWDDPRMPTIVGIRRRGYTPSALQLFCERIGVAKSDSWIDYSTLEQALRDDLDPIAPRVVAVLNPLKLIIDNYPADQQEDCSAPVNPHQPDGARRVFPLSRELWIERDDFMITPSKGFFRLTPDKEVRLRYGYIIKCVGYDVDQNGEVTAVHCTYDDTTKSGTAGSDARKVKGNIHWVSARHAVHAEVRLYERLFTEAHPDAGGKDYRASLNPRAKEVIAAYIEPTITMLKAEDRVQFERHGYFVADRLDYTADKPIFNRITTLKDTWIK
jgi:glutaminyl-tRNA synthetase